MNEITLKINKEDMNGLVEAIRPLAKATCLRLDFGTSIVEDKMISKATVTTGSEQIEVGILTDIPIDGNVSGTEMSLENPAKVAVLNTADFLAVVDALLLYEMEFTVTVNDSQMILQVEGKATMPIPLVDESNMQAIIQHKENSAHMELFDPEVMYFRVPSEPFMSCAKRLGAISSKMNSGPAYMICVEDSEVLKKTIQKGNQEKTVITQNAILRFYAGSNSVFAGVTAGAICKKNAKIIRFKEKEPDNASAGYDEEKIPFDTFKAAYMETHKIKSMDGKFFFALPIHAMNIIAKMAAGSNRIDMALGTRFLRVEINNVIYTTALFNQLNLALPEMYQKMCVQFMERNAHVTIDSAELSKALKLYSVYDRDIYMRELPIEITLADSVTLRKKDANSVIPVISKESDIETMTAGLSEYLLSMSLASLPSGNISLYYGAKKGNQDMPAFLLCAGSNVPTDGDCVFLAWIDIEQAKSTITAKKAADEEKAAKKGEK